MDNNLYNLLLRSFDNTLSDNERLQLENALLSSGELRSLQEEIGNLRRRLQSVRSETFKPFFTERVIERLNTPQHSIGEYFVSVFRSVAISAAVLVIICSAYNISQDHNLTLDSALGIHHQTIEQVLALETPLE